MKLGFSSCVASRLCYGLAVVAGTGVLLMTTGCGGDHTAASAQNPPPQSLSEPVRPSENESSQPPVIPVSSNEDYASIRPEESRKLPQFEAPAVVAPVSAPVAAAAPSASGAKYHTLAKGETLYAVSRKYNVKPKDLLAANNFKDPNHLSIGTKVLIPQ